MNLLQSLAKLVALPIILLIPNISNAETIQFPYPALDINSLDSGVLLTSSSLNIDASITAIILDDTGAITVLEQPYDSFTLSSDSGSSTTAPNPDPELSFLPDDVTGSFDGSFFAGSGGSLLTGTFSGLSISGTTDQYTISADLLYTGGSLAGTLTGGKLLLAVGSNGSVAGKLGAVVPVPAAVWLFGSGLIGLIGVARRKA